MSRDYQLNYSLQKPPLFNVTLRERKARTITLVCRDYLKTDDLSALSLLDVGSSSGIIDNYLADHFGQVTGIDIDEAGMQHARSTFTKPNLQFKQDDAMQLDMAEASVDVVVCSHVYEHVPDAHTMFREIHRVLRPGGFCYFSGQNRLMIQEPHYKLPFLSLLPRPLAHYYMRLAGKGRYYHEKHVSYWALKKMVADFAIVDYSWRVIAEPHRFGVDYMLQPGTFKHRLASLVARYARWATPHIWILEKPAV